MQTSSLPAAFHAYSKPKPPRSRNHPRGQTLISPRPPVRVPIGCGVVMADNVRCSLDPPGADLVRAGGVAVMQTGQVFLSHTSDMAGFPAGRSFVQAVLDAVARAGMAPVDMRYFAAREGQPADYCQQ